MEIERVQCLLASMGYYTLRYQQAPRKGDLAIDRMKGPHLTAAVKSLQRDRGLEEDGICGPATEKEILKAVGEGWVKPGPSKPENPVDIPKAVHDYFKAKGFPEAAVAGIMGNISAESNMKPTNMEDQYQAKLGYDDDSYTAAVDDGSYTNFAGDAVGYGLCQWTWWTRKTGLLSAAKTAGKSVGDLQIQLDWTWHELKTSYGGLVKTLMHPDITVFTATERMMKDFENPADQSEAAVVRRVNIAQSYYNEFRG